MKIMNVGLSTLYNIGSNYTIRLNKEELLVFENDEDTNAKNPHAKKLEEDQEKQSQQSDAKKSDEELTPDEQQMVTELQARDKEVRAHEAAHQAAGAGMTGAASFTYQQGPDGKMYAIGGEVSISVGGGSTPEEIIANAKKVAAAAMAPGNPSAQDHAVAASARAMEIKAQQQLAQERQEELKGQETYKNSQDTNNDADTNKFDISA